MKSHSALMGTILGLCPSCLSGDVFSGIYRMNRVCAKCGYLLNPGEGYFLGSMIINYFVGAGIGILSVISLTFFAQIENFGLTIAFVILGLLIINPFLFRYSRLAWLHIDYSLKKKGV